MENYLLMINAAAAGEPEFFQEVGRVQANSADEAIRMADEYRNGNQLHNVDFFVNMTGENRPLTAKREIRLPELTAKKLAEKQAVKLSWLAAGGADCSIVISQPGNGRIVFTDSQRGEIVESFDDYNDLGKVAEAIDKYEKEGYILQN